MVIKNKKRDVEAFEKENMIPNALYYHAILDTSAGSNKEEKTAIRKNWHEEALKQLESTNLVFLDPDNGMKEEPITGRDSIKYAYISEAEDYYNRGQNIVYYCHKGRRTWDQWEKAKGLMKQHVTDAMYMALTLHRGTQRTFIFAIHEEDFKEYNQIIKKFINSGWGKQFTEEPVGDEYSSEKLTGDKLTIKLKTTKQ